MRLAARGSWIAAHMRACSVLHASCSVRGNLWELVGTCGNLWELVGTSCALLV